jgi:hypothetical protein
MRLSKKSLFIVLILALVILAGFSGKYNNIRHTEENRAVSEPAFADSPTEMAIDSGGIEVFGEQDFSYGALAIPMISRQVGNSSVGVMTLLEQ